MNTHLYHREDKSLIHTQPICPTPFSTSVDQSHYQCAMLTQTPHINPLAAVIWALLPTSLLYWDLFVD